ncbi:MAG: hypothetical protein OEL77_07065 [Nitrosopumilus sp.]|nr:hypothetical protein [Nitrosopumilus sp.]MDH3385756.1 hypothetical protein [Nitrosopumilus sp.]
MNKGIIIAIPIVIAIIVGVIAMATMSNESSNMEIEDILDKEIRTSDSPEVDEKLDEIEKIADENEYEVLPREWQTSGPFQIDRNQYAIGEKIFLRIGGLGVQEKGQIAVMRPLNNTHYSVYLTVPFDGANKEGFNYYLSPQLSAVRGLCSVDDIMGKWALVFRGTNYPNLNFEIIDKVIPGTSIDPVC